MIGTAKDGREHRRSRAGGAALRWLLAGLVSSAVLVTGVGPATASSAVRNRAVLDGPVNEENPAAGGGFLAWSQSPPGRPHHLDAFARRRGGHLFRVNRAGTQGIVGGIDGTTLVYEQDRAGSADLYLFDLVTRERTKLPPAVDTPAREYLPSISRGRILFGRFDPKTGRQTVLLYDLGTGRMRALASVVRPQRYAAGGQVNGNFAVYQTCTPTCNVFLYDIVTRTRIRIPNPRHVYQYEPAVTPDGTVFFATSGAACGVGVRIMEVPLHRAPRVLAAVPRGYDVVKMFAREPSKGVVRLFYGRPSCSTERFDVFRLVVR